MYTVCIAWPVGLKQVELSAPLCFLSAVVFSSLRFNEESEVVEEVFYNPDSDLESDCEDYQYDVSDKCVQDSSKYKPQFSGENQSMQWEANFFDEEPQTTKQSPKWKASYFHEEVKHRNKQPAFILGS